MPSVTGDARPRGKHALLRRWRCELGEYVTDASVAADGRFVAVSTGAGDIVVLDAQTGGVAFRTTAHQGSALVATFSPTGSLLATAGQDGSVLLFDPTGNKVADLPGAGGWIERVSWSRDGRFLASASGRVLRLWTAAGQPLLETEPHPSTITALAWRGDGRQIASCCYGGVHLWDVESGARGRQFGWKGSLISMAWSPDGRVIACGSQDCSVHFWRVGAGNDSEMTGYPFKPKSLAWDAASTLLATSGDTTITLWKFVGKGPEGKAPQQLKGHKAVCTALAFAPRGSRLASGSEDTGVIVWEPLRDSKPASYAFLEDEVTTVAWSPDAKTLVAADASGTVACFGVP